MRKPRDYKVGMYDFGTIHKQGIVIGIDPKQLAMNVIFPKPKQAKDFHKWLGQAIKYLDSKKGKND